MSGRKKYKSQCKGKHGYSTPNKADEARIKNHSGMAEFYCSYFCCFCSKWHVGHRIGYKTKEAALAKYNRMLDGAATATLLNSPAKK